MNARTADTETSEQVTRKAYQSPTITEYGTIQDLTMGTSGTDFDGGTGGISFGN